MPGQLRAPLIVLESLPEGVVSIRAPLLVTEPLTEHAGTQLRAPLIVNEPLTEAIRNLRCALLILESLHPVAPEGHVSTELFPGSMGSPASLPGLAFSVHKKPRFATLVHQGSSGTSVRQALMQYPIWEYDLTYEFLRDDVTAEFKTLCGFFLARQGGFDTFLFKDPDDYLVTGGELGVADGVTTQFYFKRTMGSFAEKVGQVDNGTTINVYDNGVLKTGGGVDYTLTLPNSIVFTTSPAAGHVITADFQFFFNLRFQEDTVDFEKFADKFWMASQIVLETVPQ